MLHLELETPAPHDARELRLLDPSGRPIGTIEAATERPVLGSSAPTVYLRRADPAAGPRG